MWQNYQIETRDHRNTDIHQTVPLLERPSTKEGNALPVPLEWWNELCWQTRRYLGNCFYLTLDTLINFNYWQRSRLRLEVKAGLGRVEEAKPNVYISIYHRRPTMSRWQADCSVKEPKELLCLLMEGASSGDTAVQEPLNWHRRPLCENKQTDSQTKKLLCCDFERAPWVTFAFSHLCRNKIKAGANASVKEARTNYTQSV